LFRWAERLQPSSPLAVAEKIYMELEDLLLTIIPSRVVAVLTANLTGTQTPSMDVIRASVLEELDPLLRRVAFARGQRAQTQRFASRRFAALAVMWLAVLLMDVSAVLAFGLDDRTGAVALMLRAPVALWGCVAPAFIISVGAFLYARRQNPLLLDAHKALEATRERFQD